MESIDHCQHVLNVLTQKPEFWGHKEYKRIRECISYFKAHPEMFPSLPGDMLPDAPKKRTPESTVKQLIPLLNNEMPVEVSSYWLTAEEISHQLIHAGVRRSLSLDLVLQSLQRNNKNEVHLKVWEYGGVKYYRSMAAHLADASNNVPLGQRLKGKNGTHTRVHFMPPTGYFNTYNSINAIRINSALDIIEEKMQQSSVDHCDDTSMTVRIALSTEVKTTELDENFDSKLRWEGQDIEDYDGNCLLKTSKMDNFIRESTHHSAKCGKRLVLIERNTTHQGTMVDEVWKCPCCEAKLSFHNQNMVKSTEFAQDTSYSRIQPEFNLRIAEGAKLEGINLTKLQGFLSGHMGINIPTERNLRKQVTKINSSIHNLCEERKIENRKEQ
jgi:hypothetical protein